MTGVDPFWMNENLIPGSLPTAHWRVSKRKV
jgi:hypothetical protein